MIKATFFKDSDNQYRAFSLLGHAEYAERGKDIVCSAVTALSVNAVNSIEKFTDDEIDVTVDEDTGLLTCLFKDTAGKESTLFVDSLLLGLQGVAEEYKDENYIKIFIKEV